MQLLEPELISIPYVGTPTWQQLLYHTAHLLPLFTQYTVPFTEFASEQATRDCILF